MKTTIIRMVIINVQTHRGEDSTKQFYNNMVLGKQDSGAH